MSFEFWHRWLLIATGGFALFGLVVAVFPHNPMLTIWHEAAVQTYFDGVTTPQTEAYTAFLFGPLGGTIAGFFVLAFFIVWKPFYEREPWAWHAILWGTLAWFAIDTSVSLYHGAFFNVWMVNLLTLVVMGPPLVMTYRHFKAGTSISSDSLV